MARSTCCFPSGLQKSFGPWTTYGGGGYAIKPSRQVNLSDSYHILLSAGRDIKGKNIFASTSPQWF